MITDEPKIKVALLQGCKQTGITLHGKYLLAEGFALTGKLISEASGNHVCLKNEDGAQIIKQKEILLAGEKQSTFTLPQVKIGIDFHWQQNQEQTFSGDILLSANKNFFFQSNQHRLP